MNKIEIICSHSIYKIIADFCIEILNFIIDYLSKYNNFLNLVNTMFTHDTSTNEKCAYEYYAQSSVLIT